MREETQFARSIANQPDRNGTSATGAAIYPTINKHDEAGRRNGGNPIGSLGTAVTPVIGYASCAPRTGVQDVERQCQAIARECERRGLALTEVVKERVPTSHKGLSRPGLGYIFDQISSEHCRGLVVADLARITHSAAELGAIMEWLVTAQARLVAANPAFDTDREDGQLAAAMLIEVSRWERTRLSERTRNGLQAARMSGKSTGPRAVTDDPALSERIVQMRAQGMTLQAIADRLNEEGVPTVRGGAKWRHSSVQAAAGYRRRREQTLPSSLPAPRSASRAKAERLSERPLVNQPAVSGW